MARSYRLAILEKDAMNETRSLFNRTLAPCVALGLALLFAAVTPTDARSPEDSPEVVSSPAKSALRVLYVGPDATVDPKKPSYLSGDGAKRFAKLTRERPAAFRALLTQHFESVQFVTGEEFDAEMSKAVDVTVFDVLPKVLRTSTDQGWRRYRLPDGFDQPAVTVGEVGPMMIGRFGLGLKIDHL